MPSSLVDWAQAKVKKLVKPMGKSKNKQGAGVTMPDLPASNNQPNGSLETTSTAATAAQNSAVISHMAPASPNTIVSNIASTIPAAAVDAPLSVHPTLSLSSMERQGLGSQRHENMTIATGVPVTQSSPAANTSSTGTTGSSSTANHGTVSIAGPLHAATVAPSPAHTVEYASVSSSPNASPTKALPPVIHGTSSAAGSAATDTVAHVRPMPALPTAAGGAAQYKAPVAPRAVLGTEAAGRLIIAAITPAAAADSHLPVCASTSGGNTAVNLGPNSNVGTRVAVLSTSAQGTWLQPSTMFTVAKNGVAYLSPPALLNKHYPPHVLILGLLFLPLALWIKVLMITTRLSLQVASSLVPWRASKQR